MTRKAAVETREDNIRHNRRENADIVPLGVTEMADSMDPYPSPTEERPTK